VFKTSAAAATSSRSDDKAIDPDDAEELVEVEVSSPEPQDDHARLARTTPDPQRGGHYGDGMFADLEVT
jgi:hypothetical protein